MSFKKINLIAIPTTIVILVFRTLQLLFGVDATTGFSTSPVYNIVFYSLLGALFLFFIFNIYYGRIPTPAKETKSSKLVCYTVIIFAVCCEFMSVLELLENKYKTLTDNTNIQLIRTIKIIAAVLGVAVGICIVFESVKAISRSSYKPNLLISCVLVLYFIVLLFTYYATHDTMVTVSQNLIGLFFWMLVCVFVYAYLRYLSRSKTVASYKLALIFGYSTVVLGVVTSIPRIFSSFFVKFEFTSFNSIEQLMILPVTLTVAVITYKLYASSCSEAEITQ